MSKPSPRVVITNDDGPPADDSPFIQSFITHIRQHLQWDVKPVLPNDQKSWIGGSYAIQDRVDVSYYYPSHDGTGHVSTEDKGDKVDKYLLLSGTPASCASIAIHNLYPGQVDLVLSGPNYGGNCGSAFALASGTLGAAMSAALCNIPAIAISFAIFERPIKLEHVNKALTIATQIIEKLWQKGFQDGVKLYSINIPLSKAMDGDPPIVWTSMANTNHKRLFVPASGDSKDKVDVIVDTTEKEAGPNALSPDSLPPANPTQPVSSPTTSFAFKPDIMHLIKPNITQLEHGTDLRAIHEGKISVCAVRPNFEMTGYGLAEEEREWKL